MNRNIVIALVVGLVVGFLAGGMISGRYAIATGSERTFRIDTWTGQVWYKSVVSSERLGSMHVWKRINQ